jgi:hypothetical protein
MADCVEFKVTVTLARPGEQFSPIFACEESDFVYDLGDMVAAEIHPSDREKYYYQIMCPNGSVLDDIKTLAEAGITNNSEVYVDYKEKPNMNMPVVQSIPEGLWQDYGVQLSHYIRRQGPRFFSTEECEPDDEVTFENTKGGGFMRIFRKDDKRKDSCGRNYMPVFEVTTGKVHKVPVWASAGRIGGIFIGRPPTGVV